MERIRLVETLHDALCNVRGSGGRYALRYGTRD